MERPKFVLGLKADSQTNDFSSDSDGDFFNDDSDDGTPLIAGPLPFAPPKLKFTSIVPPKNRIEDFTDASNKITKIVAGFSSIKIPKKTEALFLIPETPAIQDLDNKINSFVRGDISDIEVDENQFDDNILAQISIVRYTKNDSEPIRLYEDSKLDSRVMCLLMYLLAGRGTDNKIISFYLLRCLEEFIKFPSYAPIAQLFEKFTIHNVIEDIAKSLIELFPKHPILESVIHSLSTIDSVATEVLELKKKQEEENASIYDDDDDDMSDSFFASLKAIAAKKQAPKAVMFIDESIKNPLDSATATPKIEKITVKLPPSTLTYLLTDNTDVLGPQQFSEWLMSNRSKAVVGAPSSSKPVKDHIFLSQPLFYVNKTSLSNQNSDENEEFFMNLLRYYDSTQTMMKKLPISNVTRLFPIYYPALELINSKNASSVVVTNSCPYPNIIKAEKNAHLALSGESLIDVNKSIASLLEMVNYDKWDANRAAPQPLKEKRQLPTSHVCEEDDNFLTALALADIELICQGRSPLTGELLTINVDVYNKDHPCSDKYKRINAMYDLYTSHIYPPYISFKVAFAIASGVADIFPNTSCDMAFEAVYILWNSLPQIIDSDPSRQALLFFAEMLEKTDRYYHSVIAFDNFFRSNTSDLASSSAIAQIAYRNKDMIRAAFHYTQSIKHLINENKENEVLYLGKTVANIYQDSGLDKLAISLLSFLIMNTYNIAAPEQSDGKTVKFAPVDQTVSATGSVKQIRTKKLESVTRSDFSPSSVNINTVLAACQCVSLLISERMFSQAEDLLKAMQQVSPNVLGKSVQYLNLKLLLRRNEFSRFISEYPSIPSSCIRRAASASRLSVDAGVSFDSKSALVKLLAKGYITKRLFREAIFCGEAIVFSAPPNSHREIGEGFLIRGRALIYASQVAATSNFPFKIATAIPKSMEGVAKYIDPEASLTEEQLASETLSSLQFARLSFDKLGLIKKSVESSLLFCDYAISLFFHAILDKDSSREGFTVNVGTPNMLIRVSLMRQIESSSLTSTITQSNVANEMGIVTTILEKNVARLMNPLYIVYSQILMARLSLIRNERNHAETYYDFAWSNFQKHFSNGSIFLPKKLSFHNLYTMKQIVSLMCDTLLTFDKEYINNRLVVFDILNEIESTIKNRSNNKIDDCSSVPTPSADINPNVIELSNPKLPDFSNLLKEVTVTESNNLETDTEELYIQYFKLINANIHQFETQKLTDEEMQNRNRSLCLKMEQQAEQCRHMNQSFNPVDTSYSSGFKRNPLLKKVVLLFKIFQSIVVYIPSTGAINRVPIHVGKESKTFKISSKSYHYSFSSSSNVFSPAFIEQMASYIWVDKKNDILSNAKSSLSEMTKAANEVFGELLEDTTIFGEKPTIVKDDNTFGNSTFFKSSALKGALSTVEIGTPLVFVVGRHLAGLPIEFMLNGYFVCRAHSYTSLLLYKPTASSLPQAYAFRTNTVDDPDVIRENGIIRSVDNIRDSISSITQNEFFVTDLTSTTRKTPVPFTLFSSNKKNENYQEKFSFCNFTDLNEEALKGKKSAASLFIFSYADLVEFPELVNYFLYEYPVSFFMFIPSGVIRDAFNELNQIFARQKSRLIWNMSNKSDKEAEVKICKNGLLFVGAVQRTLMDRLKVPIAVFSPIAPIR